MNESLTIPTNTPPHNHRVLNRIVSFILRSPLHRLLSGNLMLLTFTGRKSGNAFTIPVTYLQTDRQIIVFSNQKWWQNLRGGATVRMRLRGQQVAGRAEPVEETATVAREIQTFLQRKGLRAARMINLRIDTQRQPTAAELARSAGGHVVVYITLEAN